MQQLLYKYLILNNRLNIPSLGSFSVSYQPAQLNSSTGSLDPKKPILHFKDGPPATPDTGLIPFLASEMKISPASAANELLNFSLQVMSELVEHQRARLKGLGILTKDGNGILHFDQENSSVAVQSSVAAGENNPVPAAKTTVPASISLAGEPLPSIPAVNSSPEAAPVRSDSPGMVPAGKSKLPPGQLDPSLDYAGLKSYQESPELSTIRNQLAQRREQVNSVFGDLREARERMKRVPLPGKEGSEYPGSVPPPAAVSIPPATKVPGPTASPIPPPRMPRSTTGTGRRPNPLLSPDPPPARQPIWPATDESAAWKKDSDSLSGLPIEMPARPSRPTMPPSVPPISSRRAPETNFPPFENNEPASSREPFVPPVSPTNRSWRQPAPETPPAVPFSRPTPPATEAGNVRDMRRSPLRKQPLPDFPPPPPENKTTQWPPQRNEPLPGASFHLPSRMAEQEDEDEEEVPKLGFFARIKETISGLFQRNKEEEYTVIEEQIPDEEATGRIGGIFSKASAKFEEIRSNELDAMGEDKKDYWWIYSIFLASVATVALILHLL